MSDTTTLIDLAEIERRAADHTIGVGDTSRLASVLGQGTPEEQTLREFIMNAVHACNLVGGGSVALEAVMCDGVRKIAITDTGIGMTAEIVLNCIGNISSSAYAGDRFGVGAKITGIEHSPAGIEYLTWTGDSQAVRSVLGVRPDGSAGLLPIGPAGERFVPLEADDLPRAIRAAGHGTRVILHGHSAAEDTFVWALDVASKATSSNGRRPQSIKNKGLSLYVNTRFASLPAHVRVSTAALRKSGAKGVGAGVIDNRKKDVVGLRGALNAVAEASGVVPGDGFNVHWFHVPDVKANRNFDHADNCLIRQLVAVTLHDREVPELEEIYKLDHGGSGHRALARFGLGPISGTLALIVELTDASGHHATANIYRTGLTVAGKEFDLEPYAQHFRDNLPAELDALYQASMQSRTVDFSDALRELMGKNPELFDPNHLAACAGLLSPGGQGGKTAGAGGGPGGGSTQGQTSGGGPGPRNGGRNAAAGTAGAGQARGMEPPTVTTWDLVPDEHTCCFADYDARSNVLQINYDCPFLDSELEWHLRGRERLTDNERKVARDVIAKQAVIGVMEWIIRGRQLRALTGAEHQDNWDFAETPEGLTAAAAPALGRRTEVAKQIAMKLGKG